MDSKKLKANLDWHASMSVIDVKSFHDITNFYNKFIKGFNNMCAPIVECMI
jgi:hypothetical protein